jgi:hypothetical protein
MSPAPLLRLSLRECRLILERLVQAAGAPSGMLHAVRDCALYSAILPGRGLAEMPLRLKALRGSAPAPIRLDEGGGAIIAEAQGQHAWYAAHALIDLAVERFRTRGEGRLIATNLCEPGELRVVAGLAERHGLAAALERSENKWALSVSPRPAAAQTWLERLIHEGFMVPAEIWRPLYEASHEALAPDSFESRRHAGTIRVEADGRIVGRNDEDETDLALLAPDPTQLHR